MGATIGYPLEIPFHSTSTRFPVDVPITNPFSNEQELRGDPNSDKFLTIVIPILQEGK